MRDLQPAAGHTRILLAGNAPRTGGPRGYAPSDEVQRLYPSAGRLFGACLSAGIGTRPGFARCGIGHARDSGSLDRALTRTAGAAPLRGRRNPHKRLLSRQRRGSGRLCNGRGLCAPAAGSRTVSADPHAGGESECGSARPGIFAVPCRSRIAAAPTDRIDRHIFNPRQDLPVPHGIGSVGHIALSKESPLRKDRCLWCAPIRPVRRVRLCAPAVCRGKGSSIRSYKTAGSLCTALSRCAAGQRETAGRCIRRVQPGCIRRGQTGDGDRAPLSDLQSISRAENGTRSESHRVPFSGWAKGVIRAWQGGYTPALDERRCMPDG